MNENVINQLTDMLSTSGDKNISESLNKAIEILNKNKIDDIKQAILDQDFSKISGVPKNMAFDVGKIIDSLPESKKQKLYDKFNSEEVQTALKKDKNKAIEMLIKSIS